MRESGLVWEICLTVDLDRLHNYPIVPMPIVRTPMVRPIVIVTDCLLICLVY